MCEYKDGKPGEYYVEVRVVTPGGKRLKYYFHCDEQQGAAIVALAAGIASFEEPDAN